MQDPVAKEQARELLEALKKGALRDQQIGLFFVDQTILSLRTPLSILMGYTEALSDGKLPGSPETHTTMHQVAQQAT